ncbi:MAG: hypothetical protein L6R41_000929 [Letrouitia leprolyta]|nr:MAG: hypothetical protein L6R41_000929 [Letrouitia leprolyta]
MTPEVLLIGSSPFKSAEEFISAAARNLGSHLRRIPDGETEQRSKFIAWQHSALPIELVQPRRGGQPSLRDGSKKYTVDDINPVGYDEQAIASYTVFRNLKASGVVSPDTRFQVCLPTPLGVVRGFIVTEFCSMVEPLYKERLANATRCIQEHIPTTELSIQFDLPFEVAMLEVERGQLQDPDSRWESYFSPVKAGIVERITYLAGLVRPDVELGFHLCYGDFMHSHFVDPASTELLVEMANEMVKTVGPIHPVKYMQMPVPKDRNDEDYFKPLKDLAIGGTQLFLGLIHPHDEAGTQSRIRTASESCPISFGLTTECGLGRVTVEDANSVFEIAAAILKD